MKNPGSILITGGTSGIGRGLVESYSASGATVFFSGRDQRRLDEVLKSVSDAGGIAHGKIVDATDTVAMNEWIRESDKITPLDLVIANAGIGSPTEGTTDERTKATFDTNVYGVFNTVHPALELMLERGRGQVAIVSSIAAYMGMPNSPAYSASKAAVKTYGEGLRLKHKSDGIEMNVICPGVIHTNMTEDFYISVPGWVTVEYAVKKIQYGLERNHGLIAFPWYMNLPALWVSRMPEPIRELALSYYRGRTGRR